MNSLLLATCSLSVRLTLLFMLIPITCLSMRPDNIKKQISLVWPKKVFFRSIVSLTPCRGVLFVNLWLISVLDTTRLVPLVIDYLNHFSRFWPFSSGLMKPSIHPFQHCYLSHLTRCRLLSLYLSLLLEFTFLYYSSRLNCVEWLYWRQMINLFQKTDQPCFSDRYG